MNYIMLAMLVMTIVECYKKIIGFFVGSEQYNLSTIQYLMNGARGCYTYCRI